MKTKKYRILFVILILAGLMTCGWISAERGSVNADAEEAGTGATTGTEPAAPAIDTKVKPVSVDYDALWLKVDANGNKAVYYSDKSKKIWYEAKAVTEETESREYYYIDISWLSNTKESVINLKGDVDEEVVSVTFPARDSKFKVKYDKVTGEIKFENVLNSITSFEWRKATSYTWNTVLIADATNEKSAFRQEIEKLRISGASIYVRLPQVMGKQEAGTGAEATVFNPGARQSKEVKISITKRAAAPKVTIDGTKLVLNTKDTMEYSTDGEKWNSLESKMPISKIAPEALYTYMNGVANATPATQSVNVFIRVKATERKAYSKSFLLTIPAQRARPTAVRVSSPTDTTGAEVAYYSDASKFYLNFTKASKTEPYEYLVVKTGTSAPDLTKGWKAITSAKTVSISSKTAPAGSTIYIRKKTVKGNTKTNTKFEIASAYVTALVTYVQPSPTPTLAPTPTK